MIHITFSMIAELMVWGTIPLWGVLGFWESQLSITGTQHTLIQILLVVTMVGWAYLWNSLGERERLAHSTPRDAIRSGHYPTRGRFSQQDNISGIAWNGSGYRSTINDASDKIVERYSGPNH